MEDPMRFFDMLRSTRAEVEVLRTDLTTWAGTTASATTDLPRPSIQLIAAGFLSKNKQSYTVSATKSKSSYSTKSSNVQCSMAAVAEICLFLIGIMS